mgnify:CR=1 FL=1
MKNTLIRLLQDIGQILGFLFPSIVFHLLNSTRNYIYTGYIRSRFASIGTSVFEWKAYKLQGECYMHIGNENTFEKDLQLTAWNEDTCQPEIRIGHGCLFRRGCHITACNSIVIGNHLLTGTNVLITDNSHGNTDATSMDCPPQERPIVSKGAVVIGDNVWLGNNVCVLPGVTIGDGAVVGANAIVTRDVPPFSVVAGIPAKMIGGMKGNVSVSDIYGRHE